MNTSKINCGKEESIIEISREKLGCYRYGRGLGSGHEQEAKKKQRGTTTLITCFNKVCNNGGASVQCGVRHQSVAGTM